MRHSHSFSVELAQMYGIECAILINHFQFWIEQNKSTGKNFHDGHTWMYQTQKEIAAVYPYWSEDQVNRIINKLLDDEVLIKGNYNKTSFDRTVWYAFKNEEMFTIPRNRGIESKESRNRIHETAEPIPDTKPDAYTKGSDCFPKESLHELLPVTQEVFGNSSQKFPLRKEQQEIFQELKSLNLECSDEKLTILLRKYWHKGEKFIQDCIHHLKYQISKGIKFIKGRIAFITHCLNEKQSLITEKCLENMEVARQICERFPDFDVKITEKYVQCNRTLKEIGTNLDRRDFVLSLEKMYNFSR